MSLFYDDVVYVTSFGIKIGTQIWDLKHFLIQNYVANTTSSYYIPTILWHGYYIAMTFLKNRKIFSQKKKNLKLSIDTLKQEQLCHTVHR